MELHNISKALGDASLLLHTDQILLRVGSEHETVLPISGESGHSSTEINKPLMDFKQLVDEKEKTTLILKLPAKQSLLNDMKPVHVLDLHSITRSRILSMIPLQEKLILQLESYMAMYPKLRSRATEDFLISLKTDVCSSLDCLGLDFINVKNDKDEYVQAPVMHELCIYSCILDENDVFADDSDELKRRQKQSFNVSKYLKYFFNYATLFENDKKINGSKRFCCLCALSKQSNHQVLANNDPDNICWVYLRQFFIDFYTPVDFKESCATGGVPFNDVEIFMRSNYITCDDDNLGKPFIWGCTYKNKSIY